MKILCTADIHVGRRSSRIPGGESVEHSCAEAWFRIVDLALDQRVDLVAICGDLVDENNRYFEAFGVLEKGLRRLTEAGIAVILVAGNHDHDVLPRLVDSIGLPGVRLLGREGRWERAIVERSGERLAIDGWSFPTGRYPESPLLNYPALPADCPVLCMLHGDLDVPRSVYAPVSIAEMRRHPDTLFLLGHVHTSRWIDEPGAATVLYPGSPQAMDAAEPGSHGAFIVATEADGWGARFHPTSSVCYDRMSVDVENATDVAEVEGLIVSAIRDRIRVVGEEQAGVQHLHCRVELKGVTPFHRDLDDDFARRVQELETEVGSVAATVERVDVATRPARDLEAIRSIPGAPGILASLILDLEGNTLSPEQEQFLREAVRTSSSVSRASTYFPVLEQAIDPADQALQVRQELLRSANLLLDELLAQHESAA